MQRPIITDSPTMRIVARTQNLEEANQIAEQYQSNGFDTRIIKKQQGNISLYEVYAGKIQDMLGKDIRR